jgi:hypothetical protein
VYKNSFCGKLPIYNLLIKIENKKLKLKGGKYHDEDKNLF